MATSTAIEVSLRNILVATDFSGASHQALRHAVFLASRTHSKVYLFHAVPPEDVIDNPGAWDEASNLSYDEAERLKKYLFLESDHDQVQNELILREGDVWEAMLPVIKEASIDLVVIGTHARTGLQKLVLGSVAEKVFRHAPCPVLTVGPLSRYPRERHRPWQVLHPTDFSALSEAALSYAGLFTRQTHARLALLHVLYPDANEQWVHASESRLRGMAQHERAFRFGVELLVRRGDPAEQIIEVGKETRADLIVMGVRRSSGLADHRMWPIAYTVVCGSQCPVLTVRTESAV